MLWLLVSLGIAAGILAALLVVAGEQLTLRAQAIRYRRRALSFRRAALAERRARLNGESPR